LPFREQWVVPAAGVAVISFLRTVVMNLLRRGGYRSIRQGLRELAYDIKGDAGAGRRDDTCRHHLITLLGSPAVAP
jgi:hypothetical protein